jgi:amino-acid N-acetyltransferase
MLPVSIKIRPARKEDLVALTKLINSQARHGKLLKRPKNELKVCLRSFYVAVEGNKVIGGGSLEMYSKKLAEVRSLVVEPRYQRKGVASALLKKLVGEARRRKIYEVLVITDRKKLFRRAGFAEQLHGQYPLFLRP